MNETLVHASKMPRSQVEAVTTAPLTDDSGPLRAGMFRMAVAAQNLVISEEGYLRVQVVLGDIKLSSNGLKFALEPKAESPATDTNAIAN